MFQDRQIRIIYRIAIILLIAILAFLVYTKVIKFQLEQEIETKPAVLSLTTDSNIFKIDNVTIYSSANALNNSDMQLDYWDLNLYQFNDIAIKIDNHVSIDDFTKKNTIKELYIDNINYPKLPELGTPTLYYKNPEDMGTAVIDEEKKVQDRLNFGIKTSNEDEVEEPSFYTDCSNPLVLSSVNLGVKEDLTFRNTKSAVTFDGNLLLDANILLSKIVYQINFDLHIVNNLDEEYICYVSIPIKLSDENNLKTIYDGSYTMSYTKLESNRFYKLEK